jgi:hypothetical protein
MALSGRFPAGWGPRVAVEEVAESVEFADAHLAVSIQALLPVSDLR